MARLHRDSVVEMNLLAAGTPLWVVSKNPAVMYVQAKVLRAAADGVVVKNPEGQEQTVKYSECMYVNEHLDCMEANELTKVLHVNQAAVYDILKQRFLKKQIYTYARPLLVVMNPFQSVPELYSSERILKYKGMVHQDDLPPHTFAVAQKMVTQLRENQRNQSCVISGESGAGKTETTKHVMKFFATRGSDAAGDDTVQAAIMMANPLLEAFGNAKTQRNDNSSRFGRFMQLLVSEGGGIRGGRVSNFLLEKSRIILQGENERSYHIFYQMLKGLDAKRKQAYLLRKPQEYEYLKQSANVPIPGDDAKNFEEVEEAMRAIRLTNDEIDGVFQLLSAVLLTGNIRFSERDVVGEDAQAELATQADFEALSGLLGVSSPMLLSLLTKKKRLTPSGIVESPESPAQARVNVMSLGKAIYDEMFNWLIRKINQVIEVPDDGQPWMGILDIFGFEFFEVNSYEQFLINYANERLQQFFVQCVFKAEIALYKAEGIDHSMIVYQDNQEVIDVMDHRAFGILSKLEEQCLLATGTSQAFTASSKQGLARSPFFSSPKVDAAKKFIVHHSAANVEYYTDAFLVKNKDRLSADLTELLKGSQSNVLSSVFREVEVLDPRNMKGKYIGSQFQRSIAALLDLLNASEAHFIRCIKTNSQKKAFEVEPALVVNQLRCLSILEAIALQHAGFAYREPPKVFLKDFELLSLAGLVSDLSDGFKASRQLLTNVHCPTTEWQVGKTRVFLRKAGLGILDAARRDIVNKVKPLALRVQACFRANSERMDYQLQHFRMVRIQAAFRMFQQRKDQIVSEKLRRTLTGSGVLLRAIKFKKRMSEVAIFMQTSIRTQLARSWYVYLRNNQRKVRAAEELLRYWATYRAMERALFLRRKRDQDVACEWIRRTWMTVRAVNRLKTERDTQKIAHAATVIQRVYRGRMTWQHIMNLQNMRRLLWPMKRHAKKVNAAASTIQKVVRGRKARKLPFMAELLQRVQALRIGFQQRAHTEKVQAAMRGYLEQKRLQKLREAAVVVQGLLIARLESRRLRTVCYLVPKLQALRRGQMVRRAVMEEKAALLLEMEMVLVRKLERREGKLMLAFNKAVDAGLFTPTGLRIGFLKQSLDMDDVYPQGWTTCIRHFHHSEEEITHVGVGEHHTIVATRKPNALNPREHHAAIYAWGWDYRAQLGVGVQEGKVGSTSVGVPKGPLDFGVPPARMAVRQLCCGAEHTLILANGTVFAWGGNTWGQCGVLPGSPVVGRPSPIAFKGKSEMKHISCGPWHSGCCTRDGTPFVWGRAKHIGLAGLKYDVLTPLAPFSGITAEFIECGAGFSFLVSRKGNVFAFGTSSKGHLGLGSDPKMQKADRPSMLGTLFKAGEHIVEISIGHHGVLALTQQGQVWQWGNLETWIPRKRQYGRRPVSLPTRVDFSCLRTERFRVDATRGLAVKTVSSGWGDAVVQTEGGDALVWSFVDDVKDGLTLSPAVSTVPGIDESRLASLRIVGNGTMQAVLFQQQQQQIPKAKSRLATWQAAQSTSSPQTLVHDDLAGGVQGSLGPQLLAPQRDGIPLFEAGGLEGRGRRG